MFILQLRTHALSSIWQRTVYDVSRCCGYVVGIRFFTGLVPRIVADLLQTHWTLRTCCTACCATTNRREWSLCGGRRRFIASSGCSGRTAAATRAACDGEHGRWQRGRRVAGECGWRPAARLLEADDDQRQDVANRLLEERLDTSTETNVQRLLDRQQERFFYRLYRVVQKNGATLHFPKYLENYWR